jgi:hypothetical protein
VHGKNPYFARTHRQYLESKSCVFQVKVLQS